MDLAALAKSSAPVLTTNLTEWTTISATPMSTDCSPPPAGNCPLIYFLCGNGPAPARRVDSDDPQALLDAWLAGTTAAEASAGFSSAGPAGAKGDVLVARSSWWTW